MTEIEKDEACSINARNTDCKTATINGITINCRYDNNSGMCVHKENGNNKNLQKACYRHTTDCNLENASTCTDIMRISRKIPDINGKVEFEDCDEMLNTYENIIRESDYQPIDAAREEMNLLLSQCINDDNYICTDNNGNIFPDPENNEQIEKFLNALSEDNNTNKSKIQSIMMKKINAQNKAINSESESDKKDLPDESISKKLSKKDLLLIIGGSSLGLLIIILIILLIIKSRSGKSKK